MVPRGSEAVHPSKRRAVMSDDRPWPEVPPPIARGMYDFAPPLPVVPVPHIRRIVSDMTDDEIEDLAKEILGRAPMYEVRRLAGRLRLWAARAT